MEPGLNGLALDCYGGVLQACDDLVLASPPGSKYERYGATCGGRNEAVGSCVRLYAPRFSENTATKIGLASGSPTGLIAGIRLAGHDSFDRFVLEFEPGGLPGYEVGYIKEQILPVLGDRIPLEGIILLSIAVSPAISQRDLPVRVRGDTTNVVEVALIEQGDDGVKFAAALNQQTGFEVMTLDDPPRLVVDVSHR